MILEPEKDITQYIHSKYVAEVVKSQVILIGFFKETLELCKMLGYEIEGVVLPDGEEKPDLPFLGNDNTFIKHKHKYINTKLVVVTDNPIARRKLFVKYEQEGFLFESIISTKCSISSTAIINEGCFVQSGCNISSDTVLGKGVRLNTNVNVMHDCYIGNYTSIAPNAVLLGGCKIGECSYIGANATILPNISVGDNTVIGAGSVVTRNVGCNIVVVGNPARHLKNNV